MTKKIRFWVFGAMCCVSRIAAAQGLPDAETLFRDGKALMQQGKIAEACDAFEASEQADHSVATVLSLADCRDKNRQYASAWSLFLQADSQTRTDPSKAALNRTARARAAAIEPRLSYLTVSVSNENRIEGLTLTRNGKAFDPMLWNRALAVDGGDYIIAGRAPGHEPWQTTAHVAAERARVSVEVPKFKDLGKLISPPAATAAPATEPDETEPSGDEVVRPAGMFTTRRKIALGVAGAGVIGVVTGVVFGVSAKHDQDDAYKLCPTAATPCAQADQANALLKSGRSRALEANVAFGIGAAVAIGAGVLWFTGAPDRENPRRVSVVPSVAPGEAGVALIGRF